MKQIKKGFTLIELLIVVAIIAILAAIAVPNFLEAQTRAKISRCKADMRSLSTAIETYTIDYNTYPYCNIPSLGIKTELRMNHRRMFERLTSPVSYLSSAAAFTDPFTPTKLWNNQWNAANIFDESTPRGKSDKEASRIYYYTARNNGGDANARWDEIDPGKSEAKPVWYVSEASGPDLTRHQMVDALNLFPAGDERFAAAMYNATNGTVSRGSIWRVGGGPGKVQDKEFYNLVQGQY